MGLKSHFKLLLFNFRGQSEYDMKTISFLFYFRLILLIDLFSKDFIINDSYFLPNLRHY